MARNLASPYLGREPKAKVVKLVVVKQIKGPERALLTMRLNHDGKYCLRVGTN